jgi:hypothetical protein
MAKATQISISRDQTGLSCRRWPVPELVATRVSHVAIFRFEKEHVDDAMTAFRTLASSSRRDPGNLRYDIYRGIDDDQDFYVRSSGLQRRP